MRRMRAGWLLGLGLAACGGEDGEPAAPARSACELAELLLSESLEALKAGSPACRTDDECVVVPVSLEAASAEIHLCGDVLHREVAPKWDPAAIGRAVDAEIGASDVRCTVSASCASFRPVCRQSRCAGERDP